MIRTNYDQASTINPCTMRFLYQGDDPNANTGGGHSGILWCIGLVTQTKSPC